MVVRLVYYIKDSYTIQQHPFEPFIKLWSMATKEFQAILDTENSYSAPFSHLSNHKTNVSSDDNDEHLQDSIECF